MADRIIQTADLSNINSSLRDLRAGLENVSNQVIAVDHIATTTQKDLANLWEEFRDFVASDMRAKELSLAETRQVKIRQEIDNKYGHYDQVRRIATGVLQAADIKVVRQDTMQNATEELMLLTPQYWLAPALVALGAWLNDNQDLALRALNETLKRDDEKASLFFALIARRAQRENACQTWLDRYLGQQDPFSLDRQTVVLVDALVNGVFGASIRQHCSIGIEKWVDELESQAGFVEAQREQWKDAIKAKYPNQDYQHTYPNLAKFSQPEDWLAISNSLNQTKIHAVLTKYFSDIFEGEIKPAPSLSAEIDLLLDKLVKNFDDEELPLRQQEHLCQMIIDEMGDRKTAEERYDLAKKSLYDKVSFTQLLTNAAMQPEVSHASVATQRYAIALSKNWIEDAHQDLTAKIRMDLPQNITLSVSGCDWKGVTLNGENEAQLVQDLQNYIEQLKQVELTKVKLPVAAYVKAAIGIGMVLFSSFNIVAMIIGAALLFWAFMDYKALTTRRQQVEQQYELLKQQAVQELKASLAEVVDMRKELAICDQQSEQMQHFLDGISTQQYLLSSHDRGRQVFVA